MAECSPVLSPLSLCSLPPSLPLPLSHFVLPSHPLPPPPPLELLPPKPRPHNVSPSPPLCPSLRPRPCPVLLSPAPPRGGFLGEQRAAASSPVAGLNEACRTGAAASTSLPPRPPPRVASYSSAALVRPSLPRLFFLPASPCHSTLLQ